MRDYNTIPFRSPRVKQQQKQQQQQLEKVSDHPLVAEEKKEAHPSDGKESQTTGSTLTNMSSPEDVDYRQQAAMAATVSPTSMTASDALALRREGAEATIARLRAALEESTAKDAVSKSALAKSDAVILELRSSVRQLKRQLEKTQEEKRLTEEEHRAAMQRYRELQQSQHDDAGSHQPQTEQQRKAWDEVQAKDERVGELQVQLDRAHAQMLTADMVRKELEDTLEAEQYTWELRIQDQERTIEELQNECATLSDDLEQCRKQWKDAEAGWNKEVQDLQWKLENAQKEARHWKAMQSGDTNDVETLKLRLLELEQERGELQGCLDEALKELEAVDVELQDDGLRKENERLKSMLEKGDGDLVESLKHLYRWVMERDGAYDQEHTSPQSAREIIAAVQSHLERMPANDKDLSETRRQVAELESQLSVYKGDLQAREESSSELRASLKEAVALLKPLQDAVAKADKEKASLRREMDSLRRNGHGEGAINSEEMKRLKKELDLKDQHIDKLQQEIESLELELSRAKLAAASSLINVHKTEDTGTPDSLTKAREELRAKRASEKTLKQLLRDAQTRFSTLHTQTQEMEMMNSELKGRLHDAEQKMDTQPSSDFEGPDSSQQRIIIQQEKIKEMDNELKVLKGELAGKEVELRETVIALEEAKAAVRQNRQQSIPRELQAKVHELEAKLSVSRDEIRKRKDSEKALKKSLKEALDLLKPLQTHLQDAENEKRQLSEEIRELRRNAGHEVGPVTPRSSTKETTAIRELEETVKMLESENSQLHDALEDMSQSINASHLSGVSGSQRNDSRLREEIVELQSRNVVTQARLEDAYVENHTLVESLNRREKEERAFRDEISALRDKLKNSEAELDHAKFVATSALVKVEELTADRRFDRDAMFKKKSAEVDREIEAGRGRLNQAPYRLA